MSMTTVTDTAAKSSSTEVKTGATILKPDDGPATKLIVAVHGVGDQYSYATLQTVVNQLCRFYGEPSGIPLGAFHNGRHLFSLEKERAKSKLRSVAFAEVYWAAIPREVVADQHTLEEAKTWATTIVERLRLRWTSLTNRAACDDAGFALTTQILREMIQTIAVMDRLCYLADKAGVFTFDLRKILDDYLGDVQVVTEFIDKRTLILERFADTLESAWTECANPEIDIYLIAHSEGTVVSMLGLLEAFRADPVPEWAKRVRGFMTLGSPIDKHLFFWPGLFVGLPPSEKPAAPIRWRNYYDYGDPIGFELDEAREWLQTEPRGENGIGWAGDVFEFTDEDDLGFTRYPFPGKAHVDYWQDADVFDHFITSVMEKPATASTSGAAALPAATTLPAPAAAATTTTRTEAAPPSTLISSWIISWIVPYLGVFALLLAASFIVYKAVITARGDAQLSATGILSGAAGLATLLSGVTAAVRIPRVTRLLPVRLAAVTWSVVAAVLSVWLWGGFGGGTQWGPPLPKTAIIAMYAVLILVAGGIGVRRPRWGAAPMIVMGTVVVAVAEWIALSSGPKGPAWPVIVATAAFLYLWWLGALVFDLVVVWHLYIRHSLVNERIRQITTSSDSYKPRSARRRSSRTDAQPRVSASAAAVSRADESPVTSASPG